MNKSLIALVVAIVILGAWYLYGNTNQRADEGNAIKIGAVFSLTGIASSYGESARNAMLIAVKEINESGGIDGRMVTLTIEDDQTNPESAISAFRKLTDIDGVSGVVGGNFDFVTIPLFPVAESSGVAFISPANMRIPGGLEPKGNSFVLMPDFSQVIKELKTYLAQSDVQKLGVVHFKSSFGEQIAKTLEETMTELGKGPIINEAYTSIGDNDFKTVILKLKQAGVDTVFLDMVDVDPVNFLTRARELEYHPNIISYYGIIDSFSAPDADRSLIENVVVLDWESSSPRFSALYEKHFSVIPTHTAEKSYQSIFVMAQAIAQTASPKEVARYLAMHTFETPSGTVTFNKDHAVDMALIKIEVVRNGVLVSFK